LTYLRRLVTGFPLRHPQIHTRLGHICVLWWTMWQWDGFAPIISVTSTNSHSVDCYTFINHPNLRPYIVTIVTASLNKELEKIYCHVYECDYRQGVIWWMDLLTTYTHHSELQLITELSLIYILYKSPQHPLNFLPASYVFNSRSLTSALTLEIPQPPALKSYLHSRPLRNLVYCQLTYSAISPQPPLQSSAELVYSKSKSHCDWRSASQSVSLGVKPHLGLMTRYILLFDNYGLAFVGRPL
jgi:hypothetical protein